LNPRGQVLEELCLDPPRLGVKSGLHNAAAKHVQLQRQGATSCEHQRF